MFSLPSPLRKLPLRNASSSLINFPSNSVSHFLKTQSSKTVRALHEQRKYLINEALVEFYSFDVPRWFYGTLFHRETILLLLNEATDSVHAGLPKAQL